VVCGTTVRGEVMSRGIVVRYGVGGFRPKPQKKPDPLTKEDLKGLEEAILKLIDKLDAMGSFEKGTK
jgi:hypothetical protein